MFWEVYVASSAFRDEREAQFHQGLDHLFDGVARQVYGTRRMLSLVLLNGTIPVVGSLSAGVVPFVLNLSICSGLVFVAWPLAMWLGRKLSISAIERRWAQRFEAWYVDGGFEDPPEEGDEPIDLDRLSALDPRLAVILYRLGRTKVAPSRSWVSPEKLLWPSIKEPWYFLRFSIRRAETGAVLMFSAAGLYLAGAGELAIGIYFLVALGALYVFSRATLSDTSERIDEFRFYQLFKPFGEEVRFGLVERATVRQWVYALNAENADRIRIWTDALLRELLSEIEAYRYATIVPEFVVPRLERFYGKPLGTMADEAIADFIGCD